jgi:hypothetical protein
MFVEAINATSTALNTVDLIDKSFPTVKKYLKLFKDGELNIAIFGSGGTGKTTFGKILSKKYELSSFYKPSINREDYNLDSTNVFGSVIVLPGQERKQSSWDEVLKDLPSGKIRLIIHIVSNGYNSFGEISWIQHKLYLNGMTKLEFVKEYSESCLELDLAVLRKLKQLLSLSNPKKTVMITLITKQDLWWNDRVKVREHYQNGEYQDLIQEIRNHRGANNFIHEYKSASLILENFVDGAGELLLPTTAGYDQRIKSANFNNLIDEIEKQFNVLLNVEEE